MDRLSLRLGLTVALLLAAGILTASLLIFWKHEQAVLTLARENAAAEARLVRVAVEHQMLRQDQRQGKHHGRDQRLIGRMVRELVKDGRVKRVLVLDRRGRVRVTSDPALASRRFGQSSPTCRGCHAGGKRPSSRSAVIEVDGGKILRGIEPIPNREACQRCHSPAQRYNGLIVVDVPLDRVLSRIDRAAVGFSVATVIIGLALLVGVMALFRRMVVRRLHRVESAAKAFAAGDLARRVPVRGHDTIARVEREFNTMADAVSGLLDRVEEHRRSLEKVMNSVDDGVVVLDEDRRIIAANEAYRRRFPRASDEIIGVRCCAEANGGLGCSCDDDDMGQCPTVRCLVSGEVQVSMRNRPTAEGQVRLEEVVASPIRSGGEEVRQVVEVWRDISDRRTVEARLAEHQRMVSLGMIASGFSHEVNTPLASIATCLSGIRARVQGAGSPTVDQWRDVAEYAQVAARQVERCGAITQQFLSLARGRTLDQDIIDLGDCARAVARLCEHISAAAGVSLEVRPPSRPQSVVANVSAVQQVLLNLLLNAIEASGRGQRVLVTVDPGPPPSLVVRDEGVGIQRDALPRIFEPFFSLREGGTGLGLFVSMNLAQTWYGDIQVDSTPGEGTTFRVLFPGKENDPREEQELGAT